MTYLILVLWLTLGPGTASAASTNGSSLLLADATAPPPSLDPYRVYGTQAQSFFRLIYAPLFDRDPDGKIVTPLLERWGQVEPLVWEFRLRQGIRFHDGMEVTAADVTFSLKRILDPEVGSPRRHDFSELDQIVALDPLTIRVVTKRPYALLPARLSQFSMILPDRLRGRPESEFFENPIGLGPFRLVEINREAAVLTPFSEYFGGMPKVPRIVFLFIPDPAERLRRLQAGTVDIITNVPPQYAEPVARGRRTRLVKRNSIRFMDLWPDTTRGPMASVEVRQALRFGTDIESLTKYIARGNGRPLASVSLPEDFGFNPDLRPYPFDPAKARALLAQAGHPHGFQLRGLATHDTRTLATAVAQQWAKIGVKLDIVVDGRAPIMRRWIRERGQQDLLILDPTSIIFDAGFQLRAHMDPDHPMGRSPHPRVLELLNRADVERNTGLREALLREIQVISYEQALVMPLYQVIDLYGVRDRVKGFVPSADTILRLAGVSVGP